MTTIHSLQLQLALYRESPRASYTHNDQLEELRNLQDKLQEEKTVWMRQREQQEQELNENKMAMEKLQEQLNLQQDDIKQQREQLYRKMEVLSSQGLLISPNTALNISSPLLPTSSVNSNDVDHHDAHDSQSHDTQTLSGIGTSSNTVDRRKDKWRTSSTISKNPPVNLLSATNAPKVQQNVKQKIPMKLSSLSSVTSTTGSSSTAAKIDKSNSFNTNSASATAASGGITQMFPLKLADKRSTLTPTPTVNTSTPPPSQLVPQHSRTGSSPAIIQHPQTPANHTTALTSPPTTSVTRTDSSSTFTYGQRYSLGSSANSGTPTSSKYATSTLTNQTKIPLISSLTAAPASNSTSTHRPTAPQAKPEEEEIYF